MHAWMIAVTLLTPAGDGDIARWEPVDGLGGLVADADWSTSVLWDQLSVPTVEQIAVFSFSGLGPYVCTVNALDPDVLGVLVNSPDATLSVFERTLTVIDDPLDINGIFAIASGRVSVTDATIRVNDDGNGGGFLENQDFLQLRRNAVVDAPSLVQHGTLRILATTTQANVEIIGDVMNYNLVELTSTGNSATRLEVNEGSMLNGLSLGTLVFRVGGGGDRWFRGDLTNVGTVLFEPGVTAWFDRTGATLENASNGFGIEVGTGAHWYFTGGVLDNTVAGGRGIVHLDGNAQLLLDDATILGGIFTGTGNLSPAPNDTTVTLEDIALDGAELRIHGLDTVVVRSAILNGGAITFNDTTAGNAVLLLDGDVVLSGAGEVAFTSPDANRIQGTIGDETLTLGPKQRLVTPESDDEAEVEVNLINQGVIESFGLIEITNDVIENDGEIRAIAGGDILLSDSVVDNTEGLITVLDSSRFWLSNASIIGGVVQGDGNGTLSPVPNVDPTVGMLTDVHLDGVVTGVDNLDEVVLAGVITNDGAIRLRDGGAGTARLTLDGNVTIDGAGTIEFGTNQVNRIAGALGDETLTLGAEQQLTVPEAGNDGEVLVNVVNNGTVESRGLIGFHGASFVNAGIVRAVDGGDIAFDGVLIDNTAGVIEMIGAGSRVFAHDTSVIGGVLRGDGDGQFTPPGGNTFCTLDGVHLDDLVVGVSHLDSITLRGTIVNGGLIWMNDGGSGIAELVIDGAVMLDGEGIVQALSTAACRVNGAGAGDALALGTGQRLEIPGTLDVNVPLTSAGVVSGGGHLDLGGAVLDSSGSIAPGNSIGTLNVTGGVVMAPSSRLDVEVGDGAGDRLAVTGSAALDGVVAVTLVDGFDPAPGTEYVIVTADSVSGAFSSVEGNGVWSLLSEPGSVTLTFVSASIPGDVNDDGVVDVQDMLSVLAAWGPCPDPCPPSCAADVDDDCTVSIGDLLAVLANWTAP